MKTEENFGPPGGEEREVIFRCAGLFFRAPHWCHWRTFPGAFPSSLDRASSACILDLDWIVPVAGKSTRGTVNPSADRWRAVALRVPCASRDGVIEMAFLAECALFFLRLVRPPRERFRPPLLMYKWASRLSEILKLRRAGQRFTLHPCMICIILWSRHAEKLAIRGGSMPPTRLHRVRS